MLLSVTWHLDALFRKEKGEGLLWLTWTSSIVGWQHGTCFLCDKRRGRAEWCMLLTQTLFVIVIHHSLLFIIVMPHWWCWRWYGQTWNGGYLCGVLKYTTMMNIVGCHLVATLLSVTWHLDSMLEKSVMGRGDLVHSHLFPFVGACHHSWAVVDCCHHSSVVGCHFTIGDVAPVSCVSKGEERGVIWLTCLLSVIVRNHCVLSFICCCHSSVVVYILENGLLGPSRTILR